MVPGADTPRLRIAVGALVVVLSMAVHGRALRHDFVNWDDPVYVTDNPHVRAGLAPASVRWALTSPNDGNWHPLTMLSHMADVELWGLHPAGHHATNLALHAANALLLYLLLSRLLGDARRAGLAAALFAVHPLSVESVAWVAERKNLLSTLFWLLALVVWEAYARRPEWRRYLAVLALAVCALASKPMAVTLPVTLLLVDWLRIERRARPGESRARLALRLAIEKLPFFAASAAVSVATLLAQGSQGSVKAASAFPLPTRLENAVVSSGWYLVRMVWPANLTAFYPHPGEGIPAWQIVASLLLLGLVTAGAVKASRAFRVAWVWYLATLLPVLGILQVGLQARADRYAYVPLIGPLAAIAWALPPGRLRRSARAAAAAAALGVAAVLALGASAWVQQGYWKDSVSLFERSVALYPDDPIGRGNLGMALVDRGRIDEAIPHFRRAVASGPALAEGHLNLANALASTGRLDEAIGEYGEAARLAPRDPRARYDLGITLLRAGRPAAAEGSLRQAIALEPNDAYSRIALGSALAALGRREEARAEAEQALRLAPDDRAILAQARRILR